MCAVPIHRLAWTWLPDVRVVNGLTVGIVSSDEPPAPEYLVVICGEAHGVEEVARCDRFAPGALARMRERAEFVADLLEVAEYLWTESGVLTSAIDRPG